MNQVRRPRDALFGGSLESVLSLQTIDDQMFYYGSDDGPIRCFSLKYGKRFQLITGHTSWVNQLLVVNPTESQQAVLKEKHLRDAEAFEAIREREDQEWQKHQMAVEQEKERDWMMLDEKRRTPLVLRKMRGLLNRVMNGIREEQHWRQEEITRHMKHGLPRVCEGYSMYSCSRDGDIRCWDLSDGSCAQVFQGHNCSVSCIDLLVKDEEQKILASGGSDGNVIMWNPQTTEVMNVVAGHASTVTKVKLSGNNLFSASRDSFARIMDTETMKLVSIYQPSREGIKTIELRDENTLFIGSGDSLVYTYDIRSGDCVQMYRGIHRECVNCMRLLDNDLFTGSDDRDIVQWDIRSSKPVYVYRGHLGPVTCFSLVKSGSFLFSGSLDMSVRRWDIAHRQMEIQQEEEIRKRMETERVQSAQRSRLKSASSKSKARPKKASAKKR